MKQRFHILDTIRGFCVMVMIAYHGLWTLQNMFGVRVDWFNGSVAHWVQQVTASIFIALAGFCWSLGRNPLKRSVQVLCAGCVISGVTIFFLPEAPIWFGVLTFIGSAMLCLTVLEPALKPINPWIGLTGSVVLAVLLKTVSEGYLSFGNLWALNLPEWLYANYATTYFGFAHAGFFSVDYFPLLVWFPVFLCGYFLYRLGLNLPTSAPWGISKPLRFLGRHALAVYMVHQVIIYAVLTGIFAIISLV